MVGTRASYDDVGLEALKDRIQMASGPQILEWIEAGPIDRPLYVLRTDLRERAFHDLGGLGGGYDDLMSS
jgi:hypothetical protein